MPKGIKMTHDEFIVLAKEKNPNLEFNGLYINNRSSIHCKCKKCESEWDSEARQILTGLSCKHCYYNRGKFIYPDISTEKFKEIVNEKHPDLIITGTYHQGQQEITCICSKCGYKSRVRVSLLLKNIYQCKMCIDGSENVKIGINNIKSCNPVLYDLLVDKSDNEKYNIHSRNKVYIKCPNCGKVHYKDVSQLHNRGFKCGCMDGNSLGEKYMHEVLMQANVDFEEEYNINNNLSHRYDFYIKEDKKIIVEVQWKQHNTKSFETCGGRTLEEEIKNDEIKKEYALKNGIDEYVYIESTDSGYQNLKNNILESKLPELIDLSNIDWVKAYRKSLSSDMMKVIKLWNDGYKVMQIASKMNIGKGAVRRYLMYGNEAEYCTYDHTKSNHTDVICLNTLKIYKSQRDAERYFNLHRGYLNDYLKGRRKHIIDDVEYKWMYYEDYIKRFGEIETV